MRWLSSRWEEWKQFQAHYHAVWYGRRVDEYITADPVNGLLVNATEWKILFAAAIAYTGMIYLVMYLLLNLLRLNKYAGIALICVIIRWGYMPVHFGVSSYMVRKRDRVAAYLKFKEWLQEHEIT